MTDQIQAQYEDLEQMQKQLQELEQKAKTLRGRVVVAYHEIKDGHSWEGQGAKAFIQEMDSDVLSALANLTTALNATGIAIGNIATKFKDAEEAASTKTRGSTSGTP